LKGALIDNNFKHNNTGNNAMIKTIQINWAFAMQKNIGRAIERLPLECLAMWTFAITATYFSTGA
tara:strand:- start:430 stop:624 length:195 start_codon:yes stop_codon:yes gene_type:complete